MRAFIAIALPDDVKNRLEAAVRRLAPVAHEVAWCKRDQFHLTLAFLGEIAPAILPHVTAAAERVCAACPAFACRAYGLGFFGNRRNPKVIWAGVDPTRPLAALRDGLWQELKRLGFTDGDDFRPHVTLGRCRSPARNQALTDAMEADEEVDFGAWTVGRVTLYESRPTPKGSVYRTLAQAPLA